MKINEKKIKEATERDVPHRKKYEEEVVYKTHLLVLPHFLAPERKEKSRERKGKKFRKKSSG